MRYVILLGLAPGIVAAVAGANPPTDYQEVADRSEWRWAADRADYWPDRTGCEIAARDLRAGKELWRTGVRGLGPIKHSGYSNRAALDADHRLVSVRGKESMGRYLEFLDPRTGRTLGRRIYEGPYRRKRDGEWVNLPVEKWNDASPFP